MTFLERFRIPPRRLDEVESVVHNLANILNSKEGFASFLPTFGLGSYTGRPGSIEIVNLICEEILREVEKYEPRITQPSVEVLDREGDLRVRFTLTGKVDGRPLKLLIVVHTAAGQARIEHLP